MPWRPRNTEAARGAGARPVPIEVAEAAVGSAAMAIAYLAKRLPGRRPEMLTNPRRRGGLEAE